MQNNDTPPREIPLTQGYVALIEDSDYERVSQYKWRVKIKYNKKVYAQAWINRKTILLHRFIMEARTDQFTDHKNGDGLDCRRVNMRFSNPLQNSMNRMKKPGSTSRYKGVFATHKPLKPWAASMQVNGKQKNLGNFITEEEAALRFDEVARIIQGEFGCYNFPQEGEQSALRE